MRSCRFDGVVIRFIIIFGNRKAQGWLWGFSTRGRRRRHAHHSRDVFEGWSVPCRGRCLRHGPGHASGRRRRRRWFAGNNLRLRYSLRLCNNHSRRIRSVRLSRRFVDAPEVIYRLKEFDLDIPFYGRKISRADHTANNIAPLRVRNCDGLTWREVTRKPQNRAILEQMTVLASSWVGFAGPEDASPFSSGKLRIVTATSKQTGLDRVFVL